MFNKIFQDYLKIKIFFNFKSILIILSKCLLLDIFNIWNNKIFRY